MYLGCKWEGNLCQCQWMLEIVQYSWLHWKHQESTDNLKFMALNGCLKKLWPEAVIGFHGFPNHQNKIRGILVLASELPGQRFPVWRRPIPNQRLSCCHVNWGEPWIAYRLKEPDNEADVSQQKTIYFVFSLYSME